MDISTAKQISNKLQISLDYVTREEYEVLLLKDIFESGYGSSLVFKGGTALRLVYGSPRFSEDLDFSLITGFDNAGFLEFLRKVGKRYPNITEVEVIDKFYTIFALVKINEPFLSRAFSIKIEISKRKGEWIRGKDYSYKVIKSETTPLTVLASVVSTEVILREKEDAIKNRKAARDVFDYWYLNQLLNKEIKVDFAGYDKIHAKGELHRLLPKNYWRVVDTWLE